MAVTHERLKRVNRYFSVALFYKTGAINLVSCYKVQGNSLTPDEVPTEQYDTRITFLCNHIHELQTFKMVRFYGLPDTVSKLLS